MAGTVAQLRRTAVGQPWADHLVLLSAVLYSQNILQHTIAGYLTTLHTGFGALFPALDLNSMAEWDADRHIGPYLAGALLPAHSPRHRLTFWQKYAAASTHTRRWLAGLPYEAQARHRFYCLPCVTDARDMVRRIGSRQVLATQEALRKAETDALMPFYTNLRAQAHRRYNLLARLRTAFRRASEVAERDGRALPFEFALLEGGDQRQGRPPTERLLFRLWTRRSHVLAYHTNFNANKRRNARLGIGPFAPEKNSYLLEFLRAEPLTPDGAITGLWFWELLDRNVLGEHALGGDPAERGAKQHWLRIHGYGANSTDAEAIHPFRSKLLTWTASCDDDHFIADARAKTGTIFIPLESLYIAAAFGMVALHILTANGMRINELMQLRVSADCIMPLVLPRPPGAGHDESARDVVVHWEARVVPKGHRSPKPFYFDDEHMRLLALLKLLLCEHYGLDPRTGGELPIVPFKARDDLEHRFPPGRYLFQFECIGLRQVDVACCMRFIAHGLVFHTSDGRRVTVRPHLLRHGFANWAVNIAKEPVDVVGAILHQKHLPVTKYYSQPTAQQIVAASQGLMTRIASYIDVEALTQGVRPRSGGCSLKPAPHMARWPTRAVDVAW